MWRESLCRRGQMQSSFLYLRLFLCAAEAEKTALRGALAQHCYSAVDRRNNEGLNVVLQLFLEHSAQHSLTADQVSAFICSARRPNHKHGTRQGRDATYLELYVYHLESAPSQQVMKWHCAGHLICHLA